MIKIRVKSIWQNKIGVREKYINQAIKEKQGLEITCPNGFMIIPAEEVAKKIVGKSQTRFKDKFSKEWHYLIYFLWNPNTNQGKLL